MRELQSILNNYISNTEKQKRHLAILVTLSLLVSFIVPYVLVEPADSLTKDSYNLSYYGADVLSDEGNMVSNLNGGKTANNGYSPGQLSEVTLLIGEHNDASNPTTDRIDWADGCTNAEQVIDAAKREFFIGIASEFCLFLEEDFTPTDSDTEGRVAVGGNVEYKNKENKNSNYQIAAGDFQTGSTSNPTSLIKLKDQYLGLKNFAHLIMGGNTLLDIAPYGTTDKGATIVAEDDDRYKRFVVPETFDVYANFHHEGQWANGDSIEYGKDSHSHAMGGGVSYTTSDEEAQFYGKTGLIDFSSMYDWMRGQSEKLANKTPTGTTSDFVSASVDQSKKKVIFTGPGTDAEDPTIYFTLPSWPSDLVEIEFVGIPEFTNEDGSTTYANMVVNCMDTGVVEIPQNPNRVIINGKRISKEADNEENNQKESELILYNFPLVGTDISNDPLAVNGELPKKEFEAGGEKWYAPYNFYINKNFNGTIFAPNAIVVSEKSCEGHLSGALIANSFTGGLEFGYRPYRGGTDILGSTAGYVVPFDKLAPNNKHLEGANFVIKDETGKTVESWKSGTDTQYITLPSEVDLEGGTTYTGQNNVVSHTYTIEEQSAPEGYIKTDEFYSLKITETVDVNSLISTDSGTLPTKVLVNLELYKGEAIDANLIDSRVMTIEDTYSDEGIIQRIVCIEDDGTKQYFVLDINEDGSINSVGVPTDESLALLQNDIVPEDNGTESNDGAAVVLDDVTLDYQQPDVLEGEETGDGTEDEVTEGEGTGDSTEGEASAFPEGYEAPTLTATYGQTLADVAFPEVSYGSWTWKTPSDSVGDVGTKTFEAIFTPTVEGFTAQEVQLQVTVEQATPNVHPGTYTIPFGNNLSYITIPATELGTWQWLNPSYKAEQVGTYQCTAVFTPYDSKNYKSIQVETDVIFAKAVPSYPQPTNLTAKYRQTLADVSLPTADNGTWAWKDPLTTSVGNAGTNRFNAVFTPNDNVNYSEVHLSLEVTVSKIDPVCTFPTDLKAIYGQTLQNVTLPTADNGRFEWEWSGDTVDNVGTIYKNLKFIPNDQNNYNLLTQSVAIEVSKADPNYTIPTGLTVTYGSKLSSVTLPSGWTWDAPDTDVPGSAGSTVTYSATFTPSDTNNYNIINADITLTIVQATPTVNPVYDKEKTYTQFDALPAISITEGDTPGTIQWSDKNASKLKYGENVLEWVFTPTDSTNYETATGTITITAEAIETTPITITDSKTEEVIKYNNVDYYYDPTSMMIMPLPDETPKFINEYGLVFKKLDDYGDLLPGASISLQSGTITEGNWVENTELSKPTWDWENGTSSSATIPVTEIKVNELNVDVVYRFFETAAPSEDYEIAEPIYFMKVDDSTIIYTQNEDDLTNTAVWTELNLNEGEYIIGMTDRGIYGAEITLVKTNKNGVKLDGAEFELYAVGAKNPELVYPLKGGKYFEFKNGEVNLYEWFNSVDPNTYNSDYVQNGYLKPGGYYLYEVNPPSQAYERPDGPLYFTVEERTDADGKTYYEVTADKTEVPDELCYSVTNVTVGNDQKLNVGQTFTSNQNITKIEVIVESVSNPSACAIQIKPDGTYYSDLEFNLTTGTNTFDKATYFNSRDVYINTNGEITINAWNCTISEIRFYSTTPIPTDYDINSITISPTDPYYAHTETVTVGSGTNYTVNAGSAYADKKVTKIEFDITNVNGAGIQVKGNDFGGYDTINPSSVGTFEYVPSSSNAENVRFDSSGNFLFTWWNLTVEEIRFYVEGMESSGETPDLTVSSLTAYYLDGSKATAASIDELTDKNDIVGMEVTLTGSGTGNINIGDAWTISGAKAGTYTVGVTDYKPETSVEDGDTSHLVNASGTTLTIKNEAQGQETNIIVKKSWVNDSEFTQYRPSEIEVELYRGTKADGSDKVYIGNITDDAALENFEGTVKLNESNKWQYTWEDLPSAYDYELNEDGTDNYDKPIRYYYFVKETTKLDKYTVSYPAQGSTSGDYTITNTLNTINLPVEKIWDTKNNTGIILPDSVTIKLQKKDGDNWIDVGVEPITLNEDNNWKGTFENLPTGVTYRAFEENVPNGWLYSPDEIGTSVDGTTLTVTNNLDVGKLTISKIWLNDAAGNRPGSGVKINIYRTTKRPGSGSTGGDYTGEVMTPSNVKDETVTEDYARLLQYSLYFYDANMCGDEVTETSVLSWRNDCHTDDAVVGGFHDAGDHAIFGLPEGFTASTLGWSYYEYKNTFDSLGLTNHYKIIMKEFCDFFTDSTTITNGEVTKFLYQKGDGGTDHSYWGAPETQPSRSSQMFYTTNGASDIAADYAAALAQYALIFPSDSNSQTYLETAEALFDFSTKYNTRTSEGASGFYWDGNGSCNDEQAWAAAWLYLATKDDSYKTACETKLNSCGAIPERGHFWDDVTLGAECVYNAHINPNSANASEWSKVTGYLNTYCTGDSYRVLNSWGSTRHNTLLQLAALVTDKNMKTTNYQTWCKSQMSYILGNNSIASNGNSSTCFVAGFASNSSKYPHHRAASGYASGETRDNSKYDTDGHVLLGALIGGPNANGGYVDKMDGEDLVWQTNEVTIDYNAGLVGAAAALYSVYGTGHTVTESVMVEDGLELKSGKHIYEYSEQPAALDLSDMNFSFDKVSVKNAEESYITNPNISAKLNSAFDISSTWALLPEGATLTRIVIYFTQGSTFNGQAQYTNDSGGWNGVGGSLANPTTIDVPNGEKRQYLCLWGWDGTNATVTEIRFYYTGGATIPTITLNPTSKTAKIGETFQITATGTTNTINWTSSDTDVAQVDENGNVTIKAMPESGNTVRITATDSTDSSATAYIDVKIEAMTLTPSSSDVVVGDTVEYRSNYSNAVIESGTGYIVSGNKITADSVGNHTVTATAGNASATAALNVSALAIKGESTVDTGAKPTFSVNGQPDGHTFKWTSSDPTVLSINESTGVAEALKSGTVKVTVTKDGKYTSDEFSVTVQKGALGISVKPTRIHVGKTATLSAINNEGQTVVYSSSDESLATISGNTVTAIGEGTVTITGTLGNENPTCTLEIVANPTITAPENQNLMGTGDKLQLTASNIIGTANWTSSKPEVLTVDSATGLVTAVSNGTAKIRVTDSEDKAFAEYEITVTLIADDPEIPEGLASFMTITLTDADLTAEGTWSRELDNLPKTDGNGNKYYYYIAELDSSGNIAESITGTGAIYIPMLYEGNGSALGDDTELSVSNKLTQEIQGQMPSTGGEGTEPYYIYGIILMLCSIAGYSVMKLRRGRRS